MLYCWLISLEADHD